MFTDEDLIPAYVTTKMAECSRKMYASARGRRAILELVMNSGPYSKKDWRALREFLIEAQDGERQMFVSLVTVIDRVLAARAEAPES